MRRANDPWVLGIASSFHNGAACLLRGDEIAVAIQEERLLRRKRAWVPGGQAALSIRYCLDAAGISPRDLSLVVNCSLMRGGAPLFDVRANPDLALDDAGVPSITIPHHLGHAAGAFATSGFRDAAVLVVDGFGSSADRLSGAELDAVVTEREGEEHISMYGASDGGLVPLEKHLGRFLEATSPAELARLGRMPTFGSLGGMYSAVGWQIFSDTLDGPGKVMGLAPYGAPDIPAEEFFQRSGGRFTFLDRVPRRFQHSDRWPSRREEYRNLAASAQAALEDALLALLERLRARSASDNLCYAGGVALNGVANERLISAGLFRRVHVMPAAEDSGTAVGAAYHGLWSLAGTRSRRLVRDSAGRTYSPQEIDKALQATPSIAAHRPRDVVSAAVDLLVDGRIVGWFQGGSELGPRALGQRSLLCDPRHPRLKDRLNDSVKRREPFRPFAPAILAEEARRWFEVGDGPDGPAESPFMLRVWRFRAEQGARVPAVAHVDGTGRVQTVGRDGNGLFHALLSAFHARTGVPLLLNTSFNVAGEPLVETPEDALWCLLSSGLDACVLEDRVVLREPALRSALDLEARVAGERLAPEPPPRGGGALDVADVAEVAEPLAQLLREPLGFALDARGQALEGARALTRGWTRCAAFRVQTRWGPVLQLVGPALEAVLDCIEPGGTDGWTLLERLRRRGVLAEEGHLSSWLRSLRGSGIVTFHPPGRGG